MEELDQLRDQLSHAATERELVVFNNAPNITNLPSVYWKGDWLPFLDLARQAQATLFYIEEERYNRDSIIFQEVGDPDFFETDEEESTPSPTTIERGSKAWIYTRILERIGQWDTHQGEVISVRCVWLKEGVAHHWRQEAAWVMDCREAIDAVLEEAKHIAQENRVLRSQEAALKLHECATQMATHPRFSEATSEEKREFMASQLFPDVTEEMALGYRSAASIARRAVLIYWWDIEPIEKVTKAERVRALHAQGESIRNIAAVLKMSEAKVKAALAEAS